uniref:C2 domain-containing protein n=1 Tax=Ascaris lumbricoides TaxID=6252 RepID=A0A0M3HFU1_ASCLU
GYVRVHLIQGGKVRKKRKSAVRKGSDCPVWDEALQFTIPAKSLPTSQVEVTLLDYDRIGNHKVIGKVMIGGNDEIWKDLIAGTTITPRWMKLKPP